MRVVYSKQSQDYQAKKGGFDISYSKSKFLRKNNGIVKKYYNKLSFSFKFKGASDKTYFSYTFPYTFSKLTTFLGEIKEKEPDAKEHYRETVLCKSLSGVDIPMVTITSRLTSDLSEYNLIKLSDYEDNESKVSIPMYKRKKYVVIVGRVHPGETNSSFALEGLIKYLAGNSHQATQLRKRIIFKIVPMLNVDGVIVGNYRTSMSGNDLNRQYSVPDKRLHPEVFTMRNMIKNLTYGKKKQSSQNEGIEIEQEDILAFIDMHGHSMKKNLFMYGN